MNNRDMEKYSSVFTLSDMEIFIFPELFYALLIANIMSPLIWKWRDDPWFKGIEKKSPAQRINRIKQYIMDHFVFNLDLETWGLTDKNRELDRFKDFIDEDILSRSNALFGYEGDKYYFSMDIRKHFGLDKYSTDIIPYWKTETVEAMEAFQYKDGYTAGAGECVSLSALYAAAIFVVGRIPLSDIYLIATPLHSQNYIDLEKGVLTNNRRIVTKNMWFNGTPLSAKARRALENEQITIVSHISGYIHSVFSQASIDKDSYGNLKTKLRKYLKADFSTEILSNFLRQDNECQHCFQFEVQKQGKEYYMEVEKIFEYEHTSSNSFSTDSRGALLAEIDQEEFSLVPIKDRILLNDIEEYIRNNKVTRDDQIDEMIKKLMIVVCDRTIAMFKKLKDFIHLEPKFPDEDKEFISGARLDISEKWSREEIMEYIYKKAETDPVARLSIYAFRDMGNIEWEPYIKASIERNPVVIEALKKESLEGINKILHVISNDSIYDSTRVALPDEVWNYQRGDGVEKAILLANVIRNRHPKEELQLVIIKDKVNLIFKGKPYKFESKKNFTKKISI